MTGLLPVGTTAAARRRLEPPEERPPISDPVKWVEEKTAEHPWSIQREVMRLIPEHRAVSVPACHGPGKTKLGGWLTNWWLDGAPWGTRRVVTTAPTGDQVKGLLWAEVAKTKYKAGLAGEITGLKGSGAVRWYVGDMEVAIGRKPQDLTNLDQARQAFQGYHATEGVLVIIDEATGVPLWIWQALTALLTSDQDRIIALGNPDDPASNFAKVSAPGTRWKTRHISAFECPNFTGEAVPEVVKRGTVSRQWVKDAEEDYGGKDNPLYISKVFGQFPDTSPTQVITPRMIREARERDLPGRVPGAFGVDVARSPKGDRSVIYRVRGGQARFVESWRGLPLTAKAGEDSATERVLRHARPRPAVPIVIDTDGLGVGLFDGLRAVEDDLRVVAFSAAGPARRPDKYDSRRSELWWEYRKAMERGEVDLDPADDILAAQLQQPKWRVDGRGRIHVETKPEMEKRGLKSPDHADAVIMGDAGAPNDETERDELGNALRPPPRTPKPQDKVRTRPGEGRALRSRPM